MEPNIFILLFLGAALLISLMVLGWWIGVLNGLIRAKNKVKESLGVVDSTIEQFNNLLGLLFQMTSDATGQERRLHQKILEARKELAKGFQAPNPKPSAFNLDHLDPSDALLMAHSARASSTMKYISENAPIFQSAAIYANAQSKVADAIADITGAQRMLRAAVEAQRDACETVPDCLVARFHGFRALPSLDSYADIRPQQKVWG